MKTNEIVLFFCLLPVHLINGQNNLETMSKCPFNHENPEQNLGGSGSELVLTKTTTTNQDWWPNQLNLSVLRQQSSLSNPMGETFDYHTAFSSLDYKALKADIQKVLTDSKDWWLQILEITDLCLFVWLGIVQELIGQAMVAEELQKGNSVLLP